MIPSTVAILAGGKSSRMGRDKALLDCGGTTFLERIATTAVRAGFDVLVVGRDRPLEWSVVGEVRFLLDRQPGMGAIGGLFTVLSCSNRPVVLVGCDMPNVTPEALRWLAGHEGGREAIVPSSERGKEPLFAVYHPAILPKLRTAIERGERSMQRLVARLDHESPSLPESLLPAVFNVNTREDYAAFTARLESDRTPPPASPS